MKVLDANLKRLLTRADQALAKSNLPNAPREFYRDTLRVFGQTHLSIRRLCKGGYDHDGLAGDVLSLAREQIEKHFGLSLVLTDHAKWLPAYLKSGWRSDYLFLLHDREELAELPRFREYLEEDAPRLFDRLREVLQISDQEKRVVELEATGKQIPDELKSFRIREFPTPGKISSSLRNTPRGKALARWYVEYRRYCAYSHAAMPKLLLQRAQVGDLSLCPMHRRRYLEGKLGPSVFVSALAIASASAELYETVGFDCELLESLVTVWDELSESSLLGRAIWELRIESVLPVTVGTGAQGATN